MTIITPKKGWVNINWRELWNYRELFYIFTWRDIKVRYKQTALGIAWAVFQPFFTMIIFTIFFGKLAKISSDDIPYPIFVYIGLLLWNYFSVALTNSSNALIENENILKKIYFPRLILPISSTLAAMIDFLITTVILIGIMIFYHYTPNLFGLLILPFLLFMTFIIAVGVGLILSSINVKYRDVRYALPFFIQILLFLTPVIYPSSILDSRYEWVFYLNPMTGIIETARTVLLNQGQLNLGSLCLSLLIGIIIFIIGIFYFRRMEKFFADIA